MPTRKQKREIHTPPATSLSEEYKRALKSARSELAYTIPATALALLVLILAVYARPWLVDSLRTRNSELIHPREFRVLPTGGTITYVNPDVDRLTAARQSRYRLDLEILARRFSAGRFYMSTLPASRNAPQARAMVRLRDRFRYSVIDIPGGAQLTITTSNPSAVRALHKYLQYLRERWVVRRPR